ncbi:MAG: hypothetical protein EOP84_18650, partial [Verrucomicrobiaceae bacterium]
MGTHSQPAQSLLEPGARETDLIAQVEAASELLESIIANRSILRDLSPEARERLMRAVGEVYS